MASSFGEMSLDELDKFLIAIGFKKSNDEIKRGIFSNPYSTKKSGWRLMTYEHPGRQEKVKVTIMNGQVVVESDSGKKQRTAWKPLKNVEELKKHFKL